MGKVRGQGQLQTSSAGAGQRDSAANFAPGISSVAWTQAVQVKISLISSHATLLSHTHSVC